MTARWLNESVIHIKLHFNFPHHESSEVKFSLGEGNSVALNCRKWDDEAICDLSRY